MKISKETSLKELAAIVSCALRDHGIDAVLTGGAAVVIWSGEEQQSYDLDYVSSSRRSDLERAMKMLGFTARGKDFVHPETPYFVEFPTGPLAVGQALAKAEDVVEELTRRGPIRIISPTFSVMDRLAQYFHWGDRSALDQALAVSRNCQVDFQKIKNWAVNEGMGDRFTFFRNLLRENSGRDT